MNAAIDAVVTTCPPSPWAFIRGTNVTTPLTTPPRFTPSTQSQSWNVASAMSLKRLIPAFRQTTWTFPKARSVSSAARANASRSVTSKRIACAASPSSASASSRWSSRMSAIVTRMPAATNDLAIPSPTPLPPPVMKATLPSRSRMRSDLIGSIANEPDVGGRPFMAARTATTVVRADVVGSLLRPDYLADARKAAREGTLDAVELRAVEDRAVLEAIALQEGAGIEAVTDGELRRNGWIAFIPIFEDPLFDPPVSGFEFLDAKSGWRDLWKTGAGDPADTSGLP